MAALNAGMSTGEYFVANSSQYEGQFKKVVPGTRCKTVLVTWSRSNTHLSPTTREDGIKRLGDALEKILGEKFKDGGNGAIDVKKVSLAAFLEPHFGKYGKISRLNALARQSFAYRLETPRPRLSRGR